ncbi:CD225/dispanin family protein [Nocardiopsis trehalosi]|jgi:hypothetical protein|uniref:CD225/dispanin family protein n=1 Tax=Nocardiopsis trehalosi TaxID=109329 RepID=UPI00082F765D|nr:CD225/dispanin family protein [Nocardiopsis trehalosi]
MAYHSPNSTPPSNWMVGAVLSILCCWPLAIPAIVFAAKVNSAWNAGDYAGAEDAAKKAKMFSLIAFALGAVVWIGSGIVTAMSLMAADQAVDEYNAEIDEINESLDADLEELESIAPPSFDPSLDANLDDLTESLDADLEELEQLESDLEELENY